MNTFGAPWFNDTARKAQELAQAFASTYVEPTPVAVSAARLASMIDHTMLKPEATPDDIAQVCREAIEYGFASVCANASNIGQCARLLAGHGPVAGATVGFPLGATLTEVKAYEADLAIAEGAREVDMVLNVGMLKAGEYSYVLDDIAAVADICHESDVLLKVIIEAVLLTDVETALPCLLLAAAGADYAKTSTGFNAGGATAHDVALLRAAVGPGLGVKAAGGFRSYEAAALMVAAGASRLGASASIKIVQSAPA